MTRRAAAFTVKRAFRNDAVRLVATLNAREFNGPTIAVTAACNLSTADARELAAALLAEADRADAAIAKKAQAAALREAWRRREIAAGRMKFMSAEEFFRR